MSERCQSLPESTVVSFGGRWDAKRLPNACGAGCPENAVIADVLSISDILYASCHREDLKGMGHAPPLVGEGFWKPAAMNRLVIREKASHE